MMTAEEINSDEQDRSAFEQLVNAMRYTPRPLALLGAGTSASVGYPTWDGLVSKLAAVGAEDMSPKHRGYLKALNDFAWEAEEYRRILGEHRFNTFIASEFAPRGRIGSALRLIVQMGFRHYLTTNYDNSIELAFQQLKQKVAIVDWEDDAAMGFFLRNLSRIEHATSIVYLHGRFYDPARVVLTESSYVNRYVRSDDARQKLLAILVTQPIVFIGFSVRDPDLNYIMREVNARLGTGTSHHFAFVGYELDDQKELFRNRFRRKFGIEPIFYRTSGGQAPDDHWQLTEVLADLYRRVYEKEPEPLPEDASVKESGVLGTSLDRPMVEVSGRPPVAASASQSPVEAEIGPAAPIKNPLDPQKDRWGGRSSTNSRRMCATNVRIHTPRKELCTFDLVVQTEPEASEPLLGDVIFHLHDTFRRPVFRVSVADGKAILRDVIAYGAFTVGAQADGGKTFLELDLSASNESVVCAGPGFPQWYRDR